MELHLTGQKKIWWTQHKKHKQSYKTNQRNLIGAKERREASDLILDKRVQMQVKAESLLKGKRRVEMPFQIPINADLPSSFFYAGEQMSLHRIDYNLHCKFVGLTRAPDGQNLGTVINEFKHYVLIRAVDPLPALNLVVNQEQELIAMWGSNGKTGFQVTLAKNSLTLGESACLQCAVNNRSSNVATATVRVQLLREIIARAKAADTGEPLVLEDKQIVLEHTYPMKVAKTVPDIVTE